MPINEALWAISVYVSKAARSDVLTDPPKMRALSREQIVELRIVA